MNSDEMAKKFFGLASINGILAVLFTVPILDPGLCIATPPGLFGCKSTMDVNWPGTWVLVAWIVFVLVGVAGMVFWGSMYYFRGKMTPLQNVNKAFGWLHLIFYEAGVIGATGLMAAIGYVGGSALAQGYGAPIAAEWIATKIIPPLSSDPTSVLNDMPPVVEAIFIGVTILGALIGFLSLWRMKS
ncbi:MAG TPA: hypothetical protein VEJ36_02580 [Nitrososphaerales archaeon]|nr:hypothetical protein [Nitrososphaerales archaeon]